MTPDDIARRCEAWSAHTSRRAVCVEPDGERRTWILSEGGRQCGHVRGRYEQREYGYDTWLYEWIWEAAGAGRDILGLPAYNAAEESPGR